MHAAALQTDELEAAIEGLEAWDALSLSNADYYLKHLTSQAIARPNDLQAVEDLQELINFATDVSPLSASLGAYAAGWLALRGVLQARRAQLLAKQSKTPFVLSKRHVGEILKFLFDHSGNRAVHQSELAALLNLTPARVSQLCGELDLATLIERETQGRDLRLVLTELGKQHLPEFKIKAITLVQDSGVRSAKMQLVPPKPQQIAA